MSGQPAASPGSGLVLALVGPTAVGKSEVALHLAKRLDGEIVSVDSMQVYRGMDIGTAKPSPKQQALVPHHLIDVVHFSESFDAAHFTRLARQTSREIQQRARVPILCGGTGLYLRAFFDGLGETPAGSPQLRAELEATPLSELLTELAKSDPTAYEQIDRQNPRRVMRAIEVLRLTGKPYSSQRADWSKSEHIRLPIFGLAREPEDLRKRIDARVDLMFAQGLVEETKKLLEAGLERNQTAMQALGYRQVVEHLQGVRSLAETIALVKIRTRQFAKRQMTWFRRQLSVEWIPVMPASGAEQLADEIAGKWAESVVS